MDKEENSVSALLAVSRRARKKPIRAKGKAKTVCENLIKEKYC
jgi:hypothetical protein